ncbi:hypothetical protein FRC08_002602 [Ceratobasidium sp. 394]|nr:hypothetical protein FRC08_002602 [Ceratobasidium sp. 394]
MVRFASAVAALLVITEGLVFPLALPTTTAQLNFEKLNCAFSVSLDEHKSLEYNLCPLFERSQFRVSREVETPPSRTKIQYDINLQQNLAWDGTLPTRDQCEEGTNICMTVISERPDHRLEPPRTIYVVPVAGNIQNRQLNVTSNLAPQTDASGRAPLKVAFHGGLYMGIAQEAIFSFHCDPTAKEPSEPTLTSHGDPLEDQGKHELKWLSRHACPIGGYPKTPVNEPPQKGPETPVLARPNNALRINIIVILTIIMGVVLFRRWAKRHPGRSPHQYRSLALSHIGLALHHEAGPRSPLSPQTPDSNQARRYASM